MTTRYDRIRDNLYAGIDACETAKLINFSEAEELREMIEDKLVEMEDKDHEELSSR